MINSLVWGCKINLPLRSKPLTTQQTATFNCILLPTCVVISTPPRTKNKISKRGSSIIVTVHRRHVAVVTWWLTAGEDNSISDTFSSAATLAYSTVLHKVVARRQEIELPNYSGYSEVAHYCHNTQRGGGCQMDCHNSGREWRGHRVS